MTRTWDWVKGSPLRFDKDDGMHATDQLKKALQNFQTGDFDSAASLCRRILENQPDHLHALHLSGLIAYHHGDLPLARRQLGEAAGLDGSKAAIFNDLGLVYLAENNLRQARACFEKALAGDSNRAETHNNLGLALKRMQKHDEARKAFLRAVEMKADYARAYFSLGDLHLSLNEVDLARDCFQKALHLDPAYVAAHNHLALCHMQTGDLPEAEQALLKACAIDPACPQTWCNLGNVQRRTHRFKEALGSYSKAITRKPDFAEAHFNKALVLLLLGDFTSGWSAYERRLTMFPHGSGYPNRYGLPLWQGQHLTGKTILVYDEQGFGDAFMFCRYLPALKRMGSRIVFEVRPELYQLFRTQDLTHLVFPRDNDAPETRQCDYCVPLCSLADRLFNRGISFLPQVPYIQAPDEKAAAWAQRFSAERFNVGIVWSGSQVDPSRRCPPELFKALLLSDSVRLFSLQKNDPSNQAWPVPWATNLEPELTDFSDTAGILSHLDLVVTIDTAVAHLAGAMGKPTWILLPFVPDWRWLLNRTDSPWYPSVKLYRQSRSGDWSSPMELVTKDLQKLVEVHPQAVVIGHPCQALAADDGACFNKGVELQSKGDFSAALEYYQQAVRRNPYFTQAFYNAGVCAYLQQDFKSAILYFEKSLGCDDGFPAAAYSLGLAFEAMGEVSHAIEAYGRAIRTSPQDFSSHYNLGSLFLKTGRHEEAVDILGTASALDPISWTAVNNLGLAYHHVSKLDSARQCFENALSLKPDSVVTLQNLGNLYMDLENYPKMLECYETALLNQRGDIPALINMGKMHQEQLNLDRADHFFKQALAMDPDLVEAHIAIGANHLLRGDFFQGWTEMEWRLRSPKRHLTIYPFEFDKPKWGGGTFKGKTLLVHAEQGFGDTIQFVRFLPLVKAMGGKVILQVQQPLVRLFSDLAAADAICSIEGAGEAIHDFDFYIPLMSLPGLLNIEIQNLAQESAYLTANRRFVEKWKRRPGGKGLHIGLVWSGNPVHPRNTKRNFPVDQLASLGSLTGFNWYSLQVNPQQEAMQVLKNTLGIKNWAGAFDDFADTAGAIASLDLVITVDTAVAHLSGAMGKPVWVLLPYFPDWRWMMAREDSPWYPTMKLVRQQTPGDWESVTSRLFSALRQVKMGRQMFPEQCPGN